MQTDPDQTPHFAASDLGLHYLTVSLFWDARHKWINNWSDYYWQEAHERARQEEEDRKKELALAEEAARIYEQDKVGKNH